MEQADAKKFNAKAFELLEYIKTLFPGHVKLIAAENALRMAIRANYNLPCTKFYYKLLETPPNDTKTILDHIRELSDISTVDLKDLTVLKMIPHIDSVDISVLKKSQVRRVLCSVRELTTFCGHNLNPALETRPIDVRAREFNRVYRELLRDFNVAFPHEGSDIVDRFDIALFQNDKTPSKVCLEDFRQSIMPKFMTVLRDPEQLIRTPHLFKELPYIKEYPLEEYWEISVVENETNQEVIIQKLNELIMTSTGLNGLNSGLMRTLEQTTMAHVSKAQASTDGTPDLMGIAKALLGDLQQKGSMAGLMEELRGSMPKLDGEMLTFMSQAALPAEFQNSSAGFLQGSTGAAPFGEILPKPAHYSSSSDNKKK